MKKLEELTKEELIDLITKQDKTNMKEKDTLKELTTVRLLEGDTLFIVPGSFIIGKPHSNKDSIMSGYIILSEVVLMDSLDPHAKAITFTNNFFLLAVDQIIAFTPINREDFSKLFQSHQDS